jgi:iron complex outermembrane recepter protein
MNTKLIIAIWLCSILGAFAQNTISGSIIDPQGVATPFATIMLMNAKDSSLAKGAISDDRGIFEIENAVAGNYFFTATVLGFEKLSTPTFEYKEGAYKSPVLVLKTSENELKSVTVTTRKPIIEVLADKTVFNIENNPTTQGLNALELIRKSPGASVDKDDNIMLKGKPNVVVYINGKPSQMSGGALAAFLKGLNAADIEAIEIISNPGAKYDAEGNAGILNIRLKKNKKIGTNGNLELGFQQGITPKGNAGVSLNHRDTKFNIFSNYSFSKGRYDNTLNIASTIGDSIWDQRGFDKNYNNNHNAKIGADYYLNSNNIIGFIAYGSYNKNTQSSVNDNEISRISRGRVDSILYATTSSSSSNTNANFNLNYKYTDTLGHELNLDADYGLFRNDGTSYQPNQYVNPNTGAKLTERNYRNQTPVDIDIKSIKGDYEQNIGKGKLGIGFKFSDVKTDNTFNFYNVINNSDIIDIDRTNKFTYSEKIAAGYLNYKIQFKKLGIQMGLRGENTKAKGDLIAMKPTSSKNVDTSYLNIFPNVGLSYAFSDKHAMNLTYRRSIDRPDYQALNPFENKLNELSFQRGNPFLRPQFSNSIELGYTFMQAVGLSFGYSHTDDFFTELTDRELDPQSKQETFFLTTRNLAKRDNYNISLNTPLPIKKWWNGYFSVWYNYSVNKADFGDGKIINLNVPGGGLYNEHSFTLGKDWSLQASGWMNFGGLWGNFVNRTQGMMDLGIVKKIWDGDGTIKFSFNDVFKTARWSAYNQLGTLKMDGSGTWEGRRVGVSLNYRFGNKNIKSARSRETGLESEKNRVKSK